MEKKLAEYKCETNDAISLKLGTFTTCSVTHYMSPVKKLCSHWHACVHTLSCAFTFASRLKSLHFSCSSLPGGCRWWWHYLPPRVQPPAFWRWVSSSAFITPIYQCYIEHCLYLKDAHSVAMKSQKGIDNRTLKKAFHSSCLLVMNLWQTLVLFNFNVFHLMGPVQGFFPQMWNTNCIVLSLIYYQVDVVYLTDNEKQQADEFIAHVYTNS